MRARSLPIPVQYCVDASMRDSTVSAFNVSISATAPGGRLCTRIRPEFHKNRDVEENRRSLVGVLSSCSSHSSEERGSVVDGKMDDTGFETLSVETASEFEYGPGFVERLKAKFHRLSGIGSNDAEVSTYATGKRSASVDNILSTEIEDPLLCHTLHGSPSKSQASLSTMQSQSTNDVLDAVETQRVFVVHRTMNIQPEEHPNSTSINELRRKFENNVQRRPLRNSNRAKMRNHAPVAGISDRNNDDELEFIRIGRLLRRKPVQLEEINHTHHKYPKENEHIDSKFVSIHGTTDSLKSRSIVLQKVPFIHRISEVPNLSSNASIVADNCYASQTIDECRPHSDSLDLITPPDPESSRQRTGSVPAVSVCTLDLSLPNDKSPPPEEPRPPQDFVIYGGNDYTPKPHVQDFRVSAFPYFVPPQVTSHNNDNTGVKEIQGLLNKFQRSRNERHLQRMKDSAVAEFALVSGKEPAKYNQKRLVMHVRDDIPSIGQSNGEGSVIVHRPSNLSRLNVVNTFDGIDASMQARKKCNNNMTVVPNVPAAVKRPVSTLSIMSIPPTQYDFPEKSLSAKYNEEKSKIVNIGSSEKHCNTKLICSETEQKNAVVPSPDLENFPKLVNKPLFLPKLKNTNTSFADGEVEHLISSDQTEAVDFASVLIAGDGNPVRHTLLSLVMEEDVPALMEAMNENFTCEFEDLNQSAPSKSSILYPPETRKERRKARQVSSIRFEETNPKVYTYLDELSAINKNKWVEGVHVDYETYQNIIAADVEEYKKNIADLQKWKESINAQAAEVGLTHEGGEVCIDVTSNFHHTNACDNNAMCA